MPHFSLTHFRGAPQESRGQFEEQHDVEPSQAALLLVNLYGWLLPPDHPARQGLVEIYGEPEVQRRERLVRGNLLPVMAAARRAGIALVYVSDSAPNIALEGTEIRKVMREHLAIDPLQTYAESCNEPREYLSGEGGRIAYAAELAPQPQDYYVRKWVYSGFHATWLGRLLQDLRTRVLFCAGFNGDSDLLCTMLEGHWAGYRIVLLRDCFAAVHVPAFEPETDFSTRLVHYAEGGLGFTISAGQFCDACSGAEQGGER